MTPGGEAVVPVETPGAQAGALPWWSRPWIPWILILLGMLLRVTYPLDFEWKGDEKWSFDAAERTVRGDGAWPWVGMRSSIGLDNPGFNVWPFIGIACFTRTPAGMTLGVMLLNSLALAGFVLWIRRTWAEKDRLVGYWAIALLAVSPMSVLFSRKIWTPDLFPVFLVPWLWAHSKRDQDVGAFFWGFLGILLGQLHMSGFFAGAGLVVATWLTARRTVKWLPWGVGTVCGALPMMPWLRHQWAQGFAGGGHREISLGLFGHGLKHAWGLGLDYSLGHDTARFLDGPMIGGVSTGLVKAAHVALIALALYGGVVLWIDRRSLSMPATLRLPALGTLVGIGMLQFTFVHSNEHYLAVWGPILHLVAAWVLWRRPRWLLVSALLQLFLTLNFLHYIHQHGGATGGDYGVSYARQIEISSGADR
jgi:hypothetical protein